MEIRINPSCWFFNESNYVPHLAATAIPHDPIKITTHCFRFNKSAFLDGSVTMCAVAAQSIHTSSSGIFAVISRIKRAQHAVTNVTAVVKSLAEFISEIFEFAVVVVVVRVCVVVAVACSKVQCVRVGDGGGGAISPSMAKRLSTIVA